jgi:hypothetical protein
MVQMHHPGNEVAKGAIRLVAIVFSCSAGEDGVGLGFVHELRIEKR